MALLALTVTSHDYSGSNAGQDTVRVTCTGNGGVYPTGGVVVTIALLNAALAAFSPAVNRDISTIEHCTVSAEAYTNHCNWIKSSTVASLILRTVASSDAQVANTTDLTTDLLNFVFICKK